MTHEHVSLDVDLNSMARLLAGIRIRRPLKPKWLVIQTKGANEALIYAETFWRKRSAVRARNARNASVRVVQSVPFVGPVSLGTTRVAYLVKLPLG